VTDAFENMLKRSIPENTLMRQLVTDIAADRLGAEGILVALGASRGETIARINEERPRIKAHAIEVAPAMLEVMRKRWPQDGAMDHRVMVYDADLRHGLRTPTAHVTTSVVTLQFTPIEVPAGDPPELRGLDSGEGKGKLMAKGADDAGSAEGGPHSTGDMAFLPVRLKARTWRARSPARAERSFARSRSRHATGRLTSTQLPSRDRPPDPRHAGARVADVRAAS
jgi:hypothetical protein